MLLSIEGKWLKVIVHMTKSEILILLHLKQVQLLISIRIQGKFRLSTISTLVGFQKDIQQLYLTSKNLFKGQSFHYSFDNYS